VTQLLSITAASLRLDCSRGHVYNLIAAGQLRAVEIKPSTSSRSKTRVREEDLEAFIESMTRSAPSTTTVRGGGRSEVRRIDGT
jgi:excisionase family DNA binding protein